MTNLFIISLLSINSLSAKEFDYSYGAKKYRVTYQEDKLHLKTVDIDLMFTPKPCFQKDYEQLKAQLEGLLTEATIHTKKEADLSLNYESKNYAISSQSKLGQRILSLPKTFVQYKLMEKDACKK